MHTGTQNRHPAPAEVFPAGEFIREELEARGWTQRDLARILDRPIQVVNQIVNGKKAITPDTAIGLGQALGTSADLWLNLDVTYRLSLARRRQAAYARAVARRATARLSAA